MTVSISYEPFERLIASLHDDGLLKESELLLSMIHEVAWTTGSELLGELGQTIKKIAKANIHDLSDRSKKDLREAMNMVKRVWPDFPE